MMKKKRCVIPKAEEVREKLRVSKVSKKAGVFTARRGFFYTHGRSEKDLVQRIKEKYPKAKIIDSGEQWTSFRGGAPIERQSHWFVKFKLPCEVR